MKIPQDIAQLLGVTIRDVLWYRNNVDGYLKDCGVTPLTLKMAREHAQGKATVQLIPAVLEELYKAGEPGEKIAQQMLTKLFYWNDLHTVEKDRMDKAVASIKAFREAVTRYQAQQKYLQEQEKQIHQERVSRRQVKEIDHKRLQEFRDRFLSIHKLEDHQERGNKFQDLLNDIFDYHCDESKGPFRRVGEQVDGLFKLDSHWYFVEARWKSDPANAGDVSILRDRARRGFGGDTKGLFISFVGFSSECLECLTGGIEERVILMDGYDLHCVLDAQIPFETLISEKQVALIQEGRAFTSAKDILAKLRQS